MLLLQAATPSSATAPKAPSEIVAAAPAADWVDIAPNDLLVMQLAPDRDGAGRKVVIQLMPPPFSQPWIANIRTLAKAHWWDGTAVTRVQDNYVAQWGDPTEKKPLPAAMMKTTESGYSVDGIAVQLAKFGAERTPEAEASTAEALDAAAPRKTRPSGQKDWHERDPYASFVEIYQGWPVASEGHRSTARYWPVHCYGMVGVGRNLSPDAGTGAELYTVIGHAPRHLDRNIALVGRVVDGIENLSSLPRGTGPLGVYEKAEQRVPIVSIRLASELPEAERPHLQYLSTESASFAAYANARANRKDAFFIVPAGGADICNIPVPIRRKP
ncbi:peptidylprolyl isomerase [Sphingomonas changbaiensis]|nr:peptidylprolyl isomerase [Sphingomonas changbaiensis]